MRLFRLVAGAPMLERFPDQLDMAESYGGYLPINAAGSGGERFADNWDMGELYNAYEPLGQFGRAEDRFPDRAGGANDLY